ncbi:Iron stress-induced chlorophyll-binding protein [Halomicronema hongdechloris C2206]|uniref:Iron stress-induced chlorophyll-binding protein n=1 Tax=Halomicronema hongdechloris C2206 TaxID=1641165 RepID=A0A1Z3HLH0_9CYAN|nr:chlorophyll a/b binding light-harvesting protein [Halomicronema hongdechloris]ASC71138.1 Iron stress-induced chlorophyll-binding protein [Halomicronema hongdechloris C2206]
MMYAVNKTQERYPWWAGNARFIDLSNTFIVAHVAQAALIMLWAGVFTLFELAVYSPTQPMYAQGLILLPHLATQGWGVGANGAIANTFPFLAIGAIHIVAAGVLAGGAYFHRTRLSPNLDMERGNASKFHFNWDDPKQLGFILGHHLAILGLGALLLVAKAMFFGGLYDATLGEVRVVSDPTLDVGTIFSYRTHLFDVNNLEDLVGGHIYVAVLLVLGGAWHILVPPFKWVRQLFLFSANGILAYSLFGIALAGFAASYYCGFSSLAYPVEFYGPTLELKSAFLPAYFDPNATLTEGYTSRTWLANTHFYLAFFFLQGGLWHYQIATGLDINKVVQTWRQNLAEASDNPTLVYQNPVHPSPQPLLEVQYEAPQVRPGSLLKQEYIPEDYLYHPPSLGKHAPSLAEVKGVRTTLYETTFHPRKLTFYHPPAEAEAKALFGGYGGRTTQRIYEQPKVPHQQLNYPSPIDPVMYEPSQGNGHHFGSVTGASQRGSDPGVAVASSQDDADQDDADHGSHEASEAQANTPEADD